MWRPRFNTRMVNVRFVVDAVALGQVLLPVIRVSVSIIPQVLHTYFTLTFHKVMLFESTGSIGNKIDFTLSVQRVKVDVRQKAYKNINLCSSLTTN
jgi:hypothetical protein